MFKRVTEDEDEGEGEVEGDPEPVFELQRKDLPASCSAKPCVFPFAHQTSPSCSLVHTRASPSLTIVHKTDTCQKNCLGDLISAYITEGAEKNGLGN